MADSAIDRTVLTIVDRIYEAVERPERWPETIRDLGNIIGGRRDFWDSNPSTLVLTLGVILVDRAGMPIWHNRRAQEIMASADGLRIARNGLVGASPADTQVLRELVTAAV
jgi:hypothetical protein